MNKKIINGVTYELVASVSNNNLCLQGKTSQLLYNELKNEYLNAHSERDSIKKGLAMAEFIFEHFGYFQAADEYQEILSAILCYETGKRPKYKNIAFTCACMVTQKYFDTDAFYDVQKIEDVKKFYAERFPKKNSKKLF